MKAFFSFLTKLVFTLLIFFIGFVIWVLYPHENLQPLPEPLQSVESIEGMKRLARAEQSADWPALVDAYEAQSLGSYCGVASGVIVLGALGRETDQWDFFTSEASAVRSRLAVIFGGMALPDLLGLLDAHGVEVSGAHASDIDIDEFRSVIDRNLANAEDYLLVNYQRETLGQGQVGHISPVAAYDRDSDSVLIMDTAAHKYPHTWVPVDMLFAAMNETDPATGKSRGYVEVSR